MFYKKKLLHQMILISYLLVIKKHLHITQIIYYQCSEVLFMYVMEIIIK
jgi:hypothetical protein